MLPRTTAQIWRGGRPMAPPQFHFFLVVPAAIGSLNAQAGSAGQNVATSSLFDFEQWNEWHSLAPWTAETAHVSRGMIALGVQASGWALVSSSAFSTCGLLVVTIDLSLDVYIPNPQPNAWWVGEVNSSTNCTIHVVLNVSNGAGRFLLDRMGFE
jgi:hypothetical protein